MSDMYQRLHKQGCVANKFCKKEDGCPFSSQNFVIQQILPLGRAHTCPQSSASASKAIIL